MAMSTSHYDARQLVILREAWQRRVHLLERILGSLALIISLCIMISALHQKTPSLKSEALMDASAAHPETSSPQRIACHPRNDETASVKCVFDEMLNGWVPVECYDEILGKDSLRNDTELAMMSGAGQFPWYSDLNLTNPLSAESLPAHLLKPSANMTAYTLEKWHVAHCLYLWRLGLGVMNRVSRGEKGIYVNIRVIDSGHVNHCNKVIANQDHRRGAKAIVTFGYGTCVRIT